MSSSRTSRNADVIAAAADELKRRRLAATAVASSPSKGRKRGKGEVAARTSCKLWLTRKDYRQLRQLKQRLAAAGIRASRPALVRAGLLMLTDLDRDAFVQALRAMIAARQRLQEGN